MYVLFEPPCTAAASRARALESDLNADSGHIFEVRFELVGETAFTFGFLPCDETVWRCG